jgi:hypothetical protein
MAYALNQYYSDGVTTVYNLSFPYISRAHVKAYADDILLTYSWISDSVIQLSSAPANDAVISIERQTPINERIVDFSNGSLLTETDLDLANTQALFAIQETYDKIERASINGLILDHLGLTLGELLTMFNGDATAYEGFYADPSFTFMVNNGKVALNGDTLINGTVRFDHLDAYAVQEINDLATSQSNTYTDTTASGIAVDIENFVTALEAYAEAKADLAETTAKAYADGIVTTEEARAIADAQAKADAAEANAMAYTNVTASGIYSTIDRKNSTYFQSEEPTNPITHDLWVDKGSENLFNYSEVAGTSYWYKVRCSITSDVVEAPDGTMTGDKIVEDLETAQNSHHLSLYQYSYVAGEFYISSRYVKKAERTFTRMVYTAAAFGITCGIDVNLTTGDYTLVGGIEYAECRDVGNGWYRISIGHTCTTTVPSYAALLYTCEALGDPTYIGDGTSGIYVWGAQLVKGYSAITKYIPTTTTSVSTVGNNQLYSWDVDGWILAQDSTIYADSKAYADLVEVTAKAYADGIVTTEEARAIADAQAKADLAETTAKAYADGIVTAEEARAIADAQAKADAAQAAAEAYADTNFVETVTYDIDMAALQDQIDGLAEIWFDNGIPGPTVYPESVWLSPDTRATHLADLYYDKDVGGLAYRYTFDGTVYEWMVVNDSTAQALQLAQDAFDLADGKRRVFVATPYPPYDAGDLWKKTTSEIWSCVLTRETGSYTASDWEIAGTVGAPIGTTVGGISAATMATQSLLSKAELLFADSFDTYGDPPDLTSRWDVITNTVSGTRVVGLSGVGYGLHLQDTVGGKIFVVDKTIPATTCLTFMSRFKSDTGYPTAFYSGFPLLTGDNGNIFTIDVVSNYIRYRDSAGVSYNICSYSQNVVHDLMLQVNCTSGEAKVVFDGVLYGPYPLMSTSTVCTRVRLRTYSALAKSCTIDDVAIYSGDISISELVIVAQETADLARAEAQAKADLSETSSKAYADGIVTAEEARAIADAQAKADAAQAAAEAYADVVETSTKAYADGIVSTEEARAIADAQAKADLAETTAKAYADGIVTTEEARAIADAQAKADAAQAAAQSYTDSVKIILEEYADAQGYLAMTTASGYADGLVTAEEQRAISDAQAKADAAQAAAEAYAFGLRPIYYQSEEPVELGEESAIWIDQGSENVVLYSDELTNTYWTRSNLTTGVTTTSGIVNPVDPSLPVWELFEPLDTIARTHYFGHNNQVFVAGDYYMVSWYFKAAGRHHVRISIPATVNGTGGTMWASLDLSSGNITGLSSVLPTYYKVTDEGDGWYRLTLATTVAAGVSNWLALFYVESNPGTSSYIGTGVTAMYVCNPVCTLVPYDSVTKYISTTSTPVSTVGNNTIYTMEAGKWVLSQDAKILEGFNKAEEASLAAEEAASLATDALSQISDIISDSILSADEKPAIILDVEVIVSEQADIDAEATYYNITTEKTNYDNALSALTDYLATLLTPTAWNNTSGNTTIVASTFKDSFKNLYAKRQLLLSKISAESGENAFNNAVGYTDIIAAATISGANSYTDGVISELTVSGIDPYAAQVLEDVGNWRYSGTSTMIDGSKIYTGTVTADNIRATNSYQLNSGGLLSIGIDGLLTLAEGGKIAVGNGNLLIDSESNSIIVAPDGGPTGQDYCVLTDGDLHFYRYDTTLQQHMEYKYVKNMQSGEAINGSTVYLEGYYDTEPVIQVNVKDVMIYKAANAAQNQTLRVYPTNIQEVTVGSGKWKFDAVCQLVYAATAGSKTVNSSSGLITSNTYNSTPVEITPASTSSAVVTVRLTSYRGTGTVSQYYKRQVSYRVNYRVAGSGSAYSSTAYTIVPMSVLSLGATTSTLSVTFPSAASWDFYINFVAADLTAGGTFTYGSVAYDYASGTVTNSEVLYLYDQASSGDVSEAVLTLTLPAYTPPTGYTIYSVTYSSQFSYLIEANGTGYYVMTPWGHDSIVCSSTCGNAATFYPYSFTESTYNRYRLGVGTHLDPSSNYGADVEARIKNSSATIYSRKVQANSTTPQNNFEFLSYTYNLSSSTLLAGGTLNWSAAG